MNTSDINHFLLTAEVQENQIIIIHNIHNWSQSAARQSSGLAYKTRDIFAPTANITKELDHENFQRKDSNSRNILRTGNLLVGRVDLHRVFKINCPNSGQYYVEFFIKKIQSSTVTLPLRSLPSISTKRCWS